MIRYNVAMDARRALLAVLLAATACGGGGADPAPVASPAPSTASPTPSPTLPPVATDEAGVKALLVTAAEVGPRWVAQAKVNRTQTKKGELCPGKKNEQSRVAPRATGSVKMTEGTQQGAAIASFDVHAFDPAVLEDYKAAFAAATAECAAYTSLEKTYVTTELVTAPTVDGADWALARLERVYADSTKKQLYYVRQTIKVGVGRSVVALEHAFVQPASDPTGADFAKTAELLGKQVAKVAAKPLT